MKKYLFGIFAIALAIGFSAFTTNSYSAKKDSNQAPKYWYFVVDGNLTEPIDDVYFLSKDDAEEATTCNGEGDLCAVGFDVDPEITEPTPYVPNDEEQILKP